MKRYAAIVNGEYVQVDGADDLRKMIAENVPLNMYGILCQQPECTTACVNFRKGNCPFEVHKDVNGKFIHVLPFNKEGEAVTLINPKGERKNMSNIDFYELKVKFAESAPVIRWAAANGRALWKKDSEGEKVLEIDTIDCFLKERGYKVINNLTRGM